MKKENVIQLPEVTEELSPGDALPNFRDRFPKADDLNTDGCKALAAAIVLRAAMDYYEVCKKPLTVDVRNPDCWKGHSHAEWVESKDGLHLFVHTPFFQELTDINPDSFEKTIMKRRVFGKKLPTMVRDF